MKHGMLAIGTAALAFGLTACGSDSGTADSTTSAPAAASSAPAATAAGDTFGAACSAVPASGAGSFTGMAMDPVATAASNNPVLSTLVTAVKKAGLVDTLNTAKDITVFAPTNDAFAKVPKKDLDALLADKAALTKVLTYHVVPGRKTPADLAGGSFASLEGGEVKAAGSGTDYTLNGDSKVVCGNVQTANATVYIVDTVLMPGK